MHLLYQRDPTNDRRQDDGASELREKMAADVDQRLKKAVRELEEKHADGTNDVDDEDPRARVRKPANAREVRREAERLITVVFVQPWMKEKI